MASLSKTLKLCFRLSKYQNRSLEFLQFSKSRRSMRLERLLHQKLNKNLNSTYKLKKIFHHITSEASYLIKDFRKTLLLIQFLILKNEMDIKACRRNFYQNKLYLSNKFD